MKVGALAAVQTLVEEDNLEVDIPVEEDNLVGVDNSDNLVGEDTAGKDNRLDCILAAVDIHRNIGCLGLAL